MNFEFTPHDSQRVLLDKMTRFTVVNCGRRWGKTLVALYIILTALSQGKKVGYFVPTSARFENVWKKLVKFLQPLEQQAWCKINLSRHEINFNHSTGHCKFWSLEDLNAGRSEDYDLVVLDEAAFCPHLQDSWERCILATLADRSGSALILSTPDAPEGFFYDMTQYASNAKNKLWSYFKAPTWTNPLITKEEIGIIQDMLPERVFNNEYGAEFAIDLGDSFFYSQSSIIFAETKVHKEFPLHFSFDFNVNPCSVTIGQKIDYPRAYGGGCYIHDELQVQGTTRELCQLIIDGKWLDHSAGFFVTGDNSGSNLDTATDVMHNNFDVIQHMLNMNEYQFINTRGRNPLHTISRNSCNTVMHNQLLTINPKAKVLTQEVKTAKANARGQLQKDRKKYKMDLVDALRYQINAWFPEGVPQIREFKEYINKAA